jgi:nucleoside-diphosphate-sugar epimerase
LTVLILGCGYTGSRVARLLAARGERVVGTARTLDELSAVGAAGAEPLQLDADDPRSRAEVGRRFAEPHEPLRVLIAFPPGRIAGGGERTAAVLQALLGRVGRVVHLSSTVVYGRAPLVDASTPAAPERERGLLYLDAERAATEGPWPALILRAAAIYGPGRGLLAEGGPRLTRARSLDAVLSRIHVDDLATLIASALARGVTGAYPVADDEPASGRALLAAVAGTGWTPGRGLADPPLADPPGSRRVDGSAVRRALGVALRYPSFRDAIIGPR